MTSLPLLREAEAACDTLRAFIDAGLVAVTYDEAIHAHEIVKGTIAQHPALLGEVEAAADLRHERDDLIVRLRVAVHERDAERIENAHLREAFGTMEKAYNVEHRRHSDLLGLLSEYYPFEADIRECLTRSRADLAAAKAVLDGAGTIKVDLLQQYRDRYVAILVNRAALQAWQEREKR